MKRVACGARTPDRPPQPAVTGGAEVGSTASFEEGATRAT